MLFRSRVPNEPGQVPSDQDRREPARLARVSGRVSPLAGCPGPGGGSAEKPVGLVHFAAAKALSRQGETVDFTAIHHEERFGDIGRAEVRAKSVAVALSLLLRAVDLD